MELTHFLNGSLVWALAHIPNKRLKRSNCADRIGRWLARLTLFFWISARLTEPWNITTILDFSLVKALNIAIWWLKKLFPEELPFVSNLFYTFFINFIRRICKNLISYDFLLKLFLSICCFLPSGYTEAIMAVYHGGGCINFGWLVCDMYIFSSD